MYKKPKFKSHFHIEIVKPETVYLLSEKQNFTLNGLPYVLLAPFLNGLYTTDEIVHNLKEQLPAAIIYYTLLLLESKKYITESNTFFKPATEAFWNLIGVDAEVAICRLQSIKVSVLCLGETFALVGLFKAALASLNIQVAEGEEGELVVVLSDDYLQIGLDDFNREAIKSKKVWILAKPVGSVIWLGPIIRPGITACWHCLAQRLQGNREVQIAIQRQNNTSLRPFPTSCSGLPTTLYTALNLIATEVAKWIILEEHEQLENGVVTVDLASLALQHHLLIKRPQCHVCGQKDYFGNQTAKEIILLSQKKVFMEDGGHRTLTPEQTLQKYGHHVSPITGVVSTLQRTSQSNNELIHVYVAAHKFSGAANSLARLRQILRRKSAGKGKTDAQAKASGICEAIERYSGLYTGNEIKLSESFQQLKGSAIHPNDCMLFSDSQYSNRLEWNKQNYKFQYIPKVFEENRIIDWTPVWSLSYKVFKYLPTAYCYYGYPQDDSYRFCYADSNGNAAGNTREEAILQGFLELVERDSIAIWWYNRVSRPAVELDSFDDEYLHSLQCYYETLNRKLWVLDISNDFNIPTFAAISSYINTDKDDIYFGFGAHFDPKIAVLRAVTELNQALWNSPKIDIEDTLKEKDLHTWRRTATLKNHTYLLPSSNIKPKHSSEYVKQWSDDLREDILKCVDIAKKHGLEMLVLDQTHPDIGLSVVKVIVPGMRHFWARFAPGRLYDVPATMSWIEFPVTEEYLNPIPMMM